MNRIALFIFLILLTSNLTAKAYFFATDLETQVVNLDDKNIELIVTDKDDKKETEAFPIGTILKGKVFEYRFNKHFLRDEYVKVHLYEAVLPNGQVTEIDNDIKIKPRVLASGKHGVALIGAGIATALKVTVAVWSVGFPTGRGIKAVSDSAFAVYNTPEKESKLKQGTKGFVKGLLFPLPELVLKGEKLPIHDESYIWIQDAKEDEKKLSAFVVKKKNIYLSQDKYYDELDKDAPDFTAFLRPKDKMKYLKKQYKKSVRAKIKAQEKVEDEKKKQPIVIEVREDMASDIEEVSPQELKSAQEVLEEMAFEEAKESKVQELSAEKQKHIHFWQSAPSPQVIFDNH